MLMAKRKAGNIIKEQKKEKGERYERKYHNIQLQKCTNILNHLYMKFTKFQLI